MCECVCVRACMRECVPACVLPFFVNITAPSFLLEYFLFSCVWFHQGGKGRTKVKRNNRRKEGSTQADRKVKGKGKIVPEAGKRKIKKLKLKRDIN